MPPPRRRDRGRPGPDACPGAWRRHDAADGALARFRPVGGAVSATELMVLAGAAAPGGSPLEITSRGSVQVRGLDPRTADDLADALRSPAADALLDASGRDVPCSLVASPRPRRDLHGVVDDAARTVATGLRARPDVPGRLLVALDDGSGDVTGQAPDIAAARVADGARVGDGAWALLLDGADTRLRGPGPARLALAAVDAFLAVRDAGWRLAEVDDGAARVAAAVRGAVPDVHTADTDAPGVRPGPADPSRLGLTPGEPEGDPTLEVLPRLGELDLPTVGVLTALLGDGATLRVTPWRTLVLRDLADPADALARLDGLVETRPASRWAGLSACVGAPRCAKSHTDVRGDLAAAVTAGRAGGGQVRAHWIGCHRACGTPGGRVAVVEALDTGDYRAVVRAGKVTR